MFDDFLTRIATDLLAVGMLFSAGVYAAIRAPDLGSPDDTRPD